MGNISTEKIYNRFFDFVSDIRDELIVFCPYIKTDALEEFLKKIPKSKKVLIVTRWKIADLVMGSSDLDIYPMLSKFGYKLSINQNIHLKVLIKDKAEILLGSANLTNPGLGLSARFNIEAVCSLAIRDFELLAFNKIIKESLLVDDNIYRQIVDKVSIFKEARDQYKQFDNEMDKVDDVMELQNTGSIVVADFPFCEKPSELLDCIARKKFNTAAVKHDMELFQILPGVNMRNNNELIRQAFLSSDAYLWQLEKIDHEVTFGEYSSILHDSLMDDPKPYRKTVKEIVRIMFAWTEACSNEFIFKKYKHTVSINRKSN